MAKSTPIHQYTGMRTTGADPLVSATTIYVYKVLVTGGTGGNGGVQLNDSPAAINIQLRVPQDDSREFDFEESPLVFSGKIEATILAAGSNCGIWYEEGA